MSIVIVSPAPVEQVLCSGVGPVPMQLNDAAQLTGHRLHPVGTVFHMQVPLIKSGCMVCLLCDRPPRMSYQGNRCHVTGELVRSRLALHILLRTMIV